MNASDPRESEDESGAIEDKIQKCSQELLGFVAQAQEDLRQQRATWLRELESERKKLRDEYEAKHLALERRERELERIAESMKRYDGQMNDVVSVNVGGEIFGVKRSTLCIFEDTYLAHLFSGRWDENIERDQCGNYFLDFDPETFRVVVNFLRDKRIETPDHPAVMGSVSSDKQEHFANLLDFLGIREYVEIASDSELPRVAQADCPKASSSSWWSAVAPPAIQRSLARPLSRELAPKEHGERGSRSPSDSAPVQPATRSTPYLWSSERSSSDLPRAAASTRKPAAWSRNGKHPHLVIQEDSSECFCPDTRIYGGSAAVRANRAYTSGSHFWQIEVLEASDLSYIGFVAHGWDAFCDPVGQSALSWGVAADGSIWWENKQVGKLPRSFAAGSAVGLVVDLDNPKRLCHVVIDGHRYPEVFAELPSKVYPAVSNRRAPARYKLVCDLPPPHSLLSGAVAAAWQQREQTE